MYRATGLGLDLASQRFQLSADTAPKYLRDLQKRTTEVAGRTADATTNRGNAMKYALIGGAGVVVAGVIVLWIVLRKKGA